MLWFWRNNVAGIHMPPTGQCPVCHQNVETVGRLDGGADRIDVECRLCGNYILTGTALVLVDDVTEDDKAKFRGWVYDQNKLGAPPIISSETLKRIKALRPPSFLEKADRLLLELVSRTTRFGQRISPGPELIAPIYGMNNQEVAYVKESLEEKGHLKRLPGGGEFRVTPAGYIRADELKAQRNSYTQGFVAMWFSEDLREAYDKGFAKAIWAAGYDPVRIDRIEHADKIDDAIVAEIRRSRFVVTDFTGHRGGVYFEAGFALGLGIPVIWTCRKDDFAGLHFDIRQYNCIDWEDVQDLALRLQVRIEALLGEGPNKG